VIPDPGHHEAPGGKKEGRAEGQLIQGPRALDDEALGW